MPDRPQSFLGTLLYKGASASASLYLTWSAADMLAKGSLRQISPSVFRHDATVVVIRHLSGLSDIPQHDRLIYVIDDDWRSGLTDGSLPLSYRIQLGAEFLRTVPRIERQATTILAASEELVDRYRERYPDKNILPISPAWPKSNSALADRLPKSIAYLSAGTHLADAMFIVPILEEVLGSHPELSVTTSHSFAVPQFWKGRYDVNQIPRMGWSEYLEWMHNQRFDILLYPLLNTPFNASRSANKVAESDQFGAALISSDSWRAGRTAAESGQILFKKNKQSQWIDAILDVLETPGSANALATKNRSAFTMNPPLISQKSLWSGLLSTSNLRH